MFWAEFNKVNYHINGIMNSERYKNVLAGGSSSKYLQQAQDELGKLMARAYNHYTDPENIKSSVRSCGKGLSKLKHPIGSTALVKVGGKGKRIVDYVDKLARLLLDRNVQENAAILVALGQDADWPGDENKN